MDKLIAGVTPLPSLHITIHPPQAETDVPVEIGVINGLESELITLRRQHADLSADYARLYEALEAIKGGLIPCLDYAHRHGMSEWRIGTVPVAEDALKAVRKGGTSGTP